MSEITEDSLMIAGGGPRRGGRPRVEHPQVPVITRLPPKQYDRLIKMASQRDETVSELVRHILLSQSFLK